VQEGKNAEMNCFRTKRPFVGEDGIMVGRTAHDKKKLLTVDGEPDVREIIKDEFPALRYPAQEFDDALTFIKEEGFYLVILNIMGVNHYQLLKA
jgi:hypothetical protein